MRDEEEIKRIKEKLDFFFKEKVVVHIEKKDKRFLNGLLIEKKSDNVYILKDRVLGLIHIFVSDVYDIDEFQEERK